jgi:hypothetical protein
LCESYLLSSAEMWNSVFVVAWCRKAKSRPWLRLRGQSGGEARETKRASAEEKREEDKNSYVKRRQDGGKRGSFGGKLIFLAGNMTPHTQPPHHFYYSSTKLKQAGAFIGNVISSLCFILVVSFLNIVI